MACVGSYAVPLGLGGALNSAPRTLCLRGDRAAAHTAGRRKFSIAAVARPPSVVWAGASEESKVGRRRKLDPCIKAPGFKV